MTPGRHSAENTDGEQDVPSVEAGDTSNDIASTVLGIDDLTGTPSDNSTDANHASHDHEGGR